MNFLSLLRLKFAFLPISIRYFLAVLISVSLYSILYLVFRPNPNGWKIVSKLGISMPLTYQMHGIDVSHHNGIIDWQRVKKMRFAKEDLSI